MAEVFRRGGGLTYSIRVHIPRNRHADVGLAFKARGGAMREIVRTLDSKDLGEARARSKGAEAQIWALVNAKLMAAGLPRIGGDWRADWMREAQAHRAVLAKATDDVVSWIEHPDGRVDEMTGRDIALYPGGLLEEITSDAKHLTQSHGPEVAAKFMAAVFETRLSVEDAASQWVAELRRRGAHRLQTINGHEAVFSLFNQFLATRQQSTKTLAMAEVTRKSARQFVQWRADMPSSKGSGLITPATIKRELSSLSGLWRWARRGGSEGVELNPWEDQGDALGPSKKRQGDDDDGEGSKRPYTAAELVTLLRATGDDWAPNGGGYGAALWDTVRLGLLTGLRANELAGLRCGDVRDSGAAVMVQTGKTANARRLVPLCPPAKAVVVARLASLARIGATDPLFPEVPPSGPDERRGKMLAQRFTVSMRRILQLDSAGLSDVDTHSLRRSFSQNLRNAMESGSRSIGPTLISALMGHKESGLALGVYAKEASPKNLARAVGAMFTHGLHPDVSQALLDTASQRPAQIRTVPAHRPARSTEPLPKPAPKRRGRPPNSMRQSSNVPAKR